MKINKIPKRGKNMKRRRVVGREQKDKIIQEMTNWEMYTDLRRENTEK